MTTITFRDRIMAADSRAYSGDKMPMGMKFKLRRGKNGALAGASSRLVGQTDAFLDWLVEEGFSPNAKLDNDSSAGVQALLAMPDGSVHYWHDGRCFSGPLAGEFFAIGSGEQFAYGAMKAGATAQEACQIACECDPWTGGPVNVLELEAPSPAPRKPRKRK